MTRDWGWGLSCSLGVVKLAGARHYVGATTRAQGVAWGGLHRSLKLGARVTRLGAEKGSWSMDLALRVARPERAASVVRLQAAELVKWRFRHGQVLASLGQLMSGPQESGQGRGDAQDQE